MTADRARVEKGAERLEQEAMGVAAGAAREPAGEAAGAGATGAGGAEAGEAADVRLERMERVALLYAEITAATRAFLAALAESDRHHDWAEAGFGSCAEWLAWRIGLTRNTANEKVRVARALERLPLTSAAMARGEISFSKARALTRVGTRENEARLLELARAGSAAHLERVVRGWRVLEREGELRVERLRHAARFFTVVPDGDGMYRVTGRLPAEVGALLMRAVDAASDALYGAGGGAVEPTAGPSVDPDAESSRAAARRRADAMGLLAERALAAGFAEGSKGANAERYQVLLHVEARGLVEDGQAGTCELEGGTRVTAETARRLTCDASVVPVRRDPAGQVLDVGRRTRTVPPALRRALLVRDRHCRFPGCASRFTDAHHVLHWVDGGETRLANTLLLCRRHHRRVHEDGWRVILDKHGRHAAFFTPEGKALAAAPPAPGIKAPGNGASPAAPLVLRNRLSGVALDPRAGQPRWRHDRDIPWSLEAAVREALEGPHGEGKAGPAREVGPRAGTGSRAGHDPAASADPWNRDVA